VGLRGSELGAFAWLEAIRRHWRDSEAWYGLCGLLEVQGSEPLCFHTPYKAFRGTIRLKNAQNMRLTRLHEAS